MPTLDEMIEEHQRKIRQYRYNLSKVNNKLYNIKNNINEIEQKLDKNIKDTEKISIYPVEPKPPQSRTVFSSKLFTKTGEKSKTFLGINWTNLFGNSKSGLD